MSNSYLWILFVIMVLSAVVLAYAIICNNDCKKRKRSKCCVYTGANYPNHPVSSADDVEYGPNQLFLELEGAGDDSDSTGFIAAQQSFSVSDNMDRIYATFSCVNSLYLYAESFTGNQSHNATGSIELDLLVDGVALPTGGHIVLNSSKIEKSINIDTGYYFGEENKSANSHTFVLRDLTPGSHLIQVQATLLLALSNSNANTNFSQATVTVNERTLVLTSGANQSQCSVKHDRCGCYKKKCCSSPSSSSSCPSSSSSSSCSSSSSSHCPSSSSHCS